MNLLGNCCFILIAFLNLTEAINANDISFYHYNKKNINDSVKINEENINGLLGQDNIVIIVHAWLESYQTLWCQHLKDIVLQKPDVSDVILLDWSKYSKNIFYPILVYDTKKIGDIFGNFLVDLNTKHGVSLQRIHVVGLSLGAQIAGVAGKTVIKSTKSKISRITGLDPAGPLFDYFGFPKSRRLTKNDADLVKVFHTDPLAFGYLWNCGTIDIYFNGYVWVQPGCPEVLPGDPLISFFYCSQLRSREFYIDALLRPQTLIATQCDSYKDYKAGKCNNGRKIDVGDYLNIEDQGVYYLDTNPHPPYGKGQN